MVPGSGPTLSGSWLLLLLTPCRPAETERDPMTFELTHVALICVGYLLVIFGVAWITERKWVPKAITQHPLTYVLSLGIFASAWAFYGVIDLAFQFGYGALAYYVGTGEIGRASCRERVGFVS